MRCIIIESPFAGTSRLPTWMPRALHRLARKLDERRNVRYARACVRDALRRGDAPLASHLLYTQPGVFNDDIPEERQWGIDAGLSWRHMARASVVYTDRGITKGMRYGIAAATRSGIPVEYRSLHDGALGAPEPVTEPIPAADEPRRPQDIETIEALGWSFVMTGPDEFEWRKFGPDGNCIAVEGDAHWARDASYARRQTGAHDTATNQAA